MPADHSFRAHDDESLLPTGPKPARQNPEDFIERSQSRSWMLSFQDGELLSKNEIFQQKSAASMQTQENGCHQQQKYAKHCRARSMIWLMRDSVTISILCNGRIGT
jgi:hypothetical protein